MQAWVNGANSSFAESIGSYCELMEIMSDNYFNNYSQSSKVFDIPKILYTDLDVTNLQRYIGTMRESADYGINVVAPVDAKTTKVICLICTTLRLMRIFLRVNIFVPYPIPMEGMSRHGMSN